MNARLADVLFERTLMAARWRGWRCSRSLDIRRLNAQVRVTYYWARTTVHAGVQITHTSTTYLSLNLTFSL